MVDSPPPPPSPSNQAEPCPGCGAPLVYDPTAGKLACPYCNSQVDVTAPTEVATVEEHDLEQWQREAEQAPLSSEALEVECSGCGAQITFEPPQVAGDCPFCATPITAQPHAASPIITPGAILPFKVERKAARHALKRWLHSRWFAPNSLKQLAQYQTFTGVYLPYWTYDCATTTTYSGERGDYYYVTKTRQVKNEQGKMVTEEYRERRTRWRRATGTVGRRFDDVLILAVTEVNRKRLAELGNWPLAALVPYDSKYLRGFQTQRYQLDLTEGFELAKNLMASDITDDIENDIGGDEQRIASRRTTYQDKTFKHILLPLWMATYRYKNQPYQVIISGDSGQVVGDRPYSTAKIALAVTAGVAAVATAVGIWAIQTGRWDPPLPGRQQPASQLVPQSSVTALPSQRENRDSEVGPRIRQLRLDEGASHFCHPVACFPQGAERRVAKDLGRPRG